MTTFQYRYLGIDVTVTSIYSMSFLFLKTFCVLSPKQSKPKLDLAKIDRSTTVRTRCVRISPFVICVHYLYYRISIPKQFFCCTYVNLVNGDFMYHKSVGVIKAIIKCFRGRVTRSSVLIPVFFKVILIVLLDIFSKEKLDYINIFNFASHTND